MIETNKNMERPTLRNKMKAMRFCDDDEEEMTHKTTLNSNSVSTTLEEVISSPVLAFVDFHSSQSQNGKMTSKPSMQSTADKSLDTSIFDVLSHVQSVSETKIMDVTSHCSKLMEERAKNVFKKDGDVEKRTNKISEKDDESGKGYFNESREQTECLLERAEPSKGCPIDSANEFPKNISEEVEMEVKLTNPDLRNEDVLEPFNMEVQLDEDIVLDEELQPHLFSQEVPLLDFEIDKKTPSLVSSFNLPSASQVQPQLFSEVGRYDPVHHMDLFDAPRNYPQTQPIGTNNSWTSPRFYDHAPTLATFPKSYPSRADFDPMVGTCRETLTSSYNKCKSYLESYLGIRLGFPTYFTWYRCAVAVHGAEMVSAMENRFREFSSSCGDDLTTLPTPFWIRKIIDLTHQIRGSGNSWQSGEFAPKTGRNHLDGFNRPVNLYGPPRGRFDEREHRKTWNVDFQDSGMHGSSGESAFGKDYSSFCSRPVCAGHQMGSAFQNDRYSSTHPIEISDRSSGTYQRDFRMDLNSPSFDSRRKLDASVSYGNHRDNVGMTNKFTNRQPFEYVTKSGLDSRERRAHNLDPLQFGLSDHQSMTEENPREKINNHQTTNHGYLGGLPSHFVAHQNRDPYFGTQTTMSSERLNVKRPYDAVDKRFLLDKYFTQPNVKNVPGEDGVAEVSSFAGAHRRGPAMYDGSGYFGSSFQ